MCKRERQRDRVCIIGKSISCYFVGRSSLSFAPNNQIITTVLLLLILECFSGLRGNNLQGVAIGEVPLPRLLGKIASGLITAKTKSICGYTKK